METTGAQSCPWLHRDFKISLRDRHINISDSQSVLPRLTENFLEICIIGLSTTCVSLSLQWILIKTVPGNPKEYSNLSHIRQVWKPALPEQRDKCPVPRFLFHLDRHEQRPSVRCTCLRLRCSVAPRMLCKISLSFLSVTRMAGQVSEQERLSPSPNRTLRCSLFTMSLPHFF